MIIMNKKFNETNNMMTGLYGGDTFEDYFVKKVLNNSKNIDKSMYNLLLKIKPLFFGLNELYKNGLSHLDIKVNNIVLHNNVFKYIDFGLSGELNIINILKIDLYLNLIIIDFIYGILLNIFIQIHLNM